MPLLRHLIRSLQKAQISGDLEREVVQIAYDSRKVARDALFVAIPGLKVDGSTFIPQALDQGAIAVVTERDPGALPAQRKGMENVTFIQVPDAREALALIAHEFWGRPTETLRLFGVTGTNGKTTTAYLIRSIFSQAGFKTANLGTVGYFIGEETLSAPQTTPEAPELQALFAEMLKKEIDCCVIEVSSHALELKRVDQCRFRAALFTNLTQDHLDFHKTMEAYFQAKLRLFKEFAPSVAVVNLDDSWGGRVLEAYSGEKLTFGIRERADITPAQVEISMKGLDLQLNTPSGTLAIRSPMTGEHNVYNILGAAAMAISQQLPLEAIAEGVASLKGVPGRFEKVDEGQDFLVIVDYAHTPDALKKLLTTARKLVRGKLLTVFGCGGDRDRGKRPLMGAISAQESDVSLVTSDNPRGEDPEAITAMIEAGIQKERGTASYQVIVDRQEAITQAIKMASSGDVVVIAGKGHETYQIFRDRTIEFDDREVARGALMAKLGAR